jgi:D-lactate dehydrogenase
MDIYFYETFGAEAAVLKSLLGQDFSYEFTPEATHEAAHAEPPARLISIRTQSIIPGNWSGKLDGILSRSTGFDHLIAYAAGRDKPLPLGYLEEYATNAVAEHAIMLALCLVRKLPQQMRQFPAFNREDLTGSECAGKNLLVVGVGRIGSEIVKMASRLGFVVRGVDIVPDKSDVSYMTKEEGVRWADIVVCAMNLTGDNRAYFNFDFFSRVKRGSLFINIARGEMSPLSDLDRALREGCLGGLGLDVFENEGELGAAMRNPESSSNAQMVLVHRILSYPNVLLTPHNAFNSTEALRRKCELTVQQIRYFFKHRDFLWKV